VVINYQRSGRSEQLRDVSLQVVSRIRESQNRTITGSTIPVCYNQTTNVYSRDCAGPTDTCDGDPGFSCVTIVPPGGYGIYFYSEGGVRNKYMLFADFLHEQRKVSGVVRIGEDFMSDKPYAGQVYASIYYDGDVSGNTDTVMSIDSLPNGIVVDEIRILKPFAEPSFERTGRHEISTTNLIPFDCVAVNPVIPADQDNVYTSLVWSSPRAELRVKPWSPEPPANNLNKYRNNAPCLDYVVKILLKQTQNNTCRQITVNGASGLIDEFSAPNCQVQ
jgi:hypothetical protein